VNQSGINLRQDIVEYRRRRMAVEGSSLGVPVPEARVVPLVPFKTDSRVICEIKRRSPSRGSIDPELDPVTQAQGYWNAGVRHCSILTEEDHFSGSLSDLIEVKSTLPSMAVLRKDFLIDLEDVDVSYRAGADAILLIASVLDDQTLTAMFQRATDLGMQVLVEVHTYEEVLRVRPLAPPLVGINCRNLATFTLDPLLPPVLFHGIDWPTKVVYESGIFTAFQARWIFSLGFRGILVGESVVRTPGLAVELVQVVQKPKPLEPTNFWSMMTRRLFYLNLAGGDPSEYRGPLVKVCGITNLEDAQIVTSAGADVLGFVFAKSPRRASLAVLRQVKELPILKVAVVVWDKMPEASEEWDEIQEAFKEGLIDAVQLHGTETPEFCQTFHYPWYKALRPKGPGEAANALEFRSPRILVDAFDPVLAGGTGKRVNGEIAQEFRQTGGLWLAGGINPENLSEILSAYFPELVDVSSGLEQSPGKKDPQKIQAFFKEMHRVRNR